MYMLALNFQLSFHCQIFFRLVSGSEKEERPGVGGLGWFEDWVSPVVSAELYGVEVKIVVTL